MAAIRPHQLIKVFVQNEAESDLKHTYDEKSLTYLSSQRVSCPYPFPYGFILNTTSDDGDNLDCFVITSRRLTRGTVVSCQPVGVLEQIEDGLADHNVLAVLPDENLAIDADIVERLKQFIMHVFAHVPDKTIEVGRLLDERSAFEIIATHSD